MPGALSGLEGEPLGLTRKRVLLRLLSTAELDRRGESIRQTEVQDLSDQLRRIHHLVEGDRMQAWLADAGLSRTQYAEIVRDWCAVIRLEGAFNRAVEELLPGQKAFASMRRFLGEGPA